MSGVGTHKGCMELRLRQGLGGVTERTSLSIAQGSQHRRANHAKPGMPVTLRAPSSWLSHRIVFVRTRPALELRTRQEATAAIPIPARYPDLHPRTLEEQGIVLGPGLHARQQFGIGDGEALTLAALRMRRYAGRARLYCCVLGALRVRCTRLRVNYVQVDMPCSNAAKRYIHNARQGNMNNVREGCTAVHQHARESPHHQQQRSRQTCVCAGAAWPARHLDWKADVHMVIELQAPCR